MQRKKRWVGLCTWFLTAAMIFSLNTPLPLYAQVQIKVTAARDLFSDVTAIRIPSKIGEVQEFYRGTQNKILILIQDAHSIPDAQNSIRRLISFFQSEYGVDLTLVEGSSRGYDAQIFRSFPDNDLLKSVFKKYLADAELTGATAAAVFSPTEGLYEGIEDWTLYEKGIDHYLNALIAERDASLMLEPFEARLEEAKARTYSKDLLFLDRTLRDFRDKKIDFLKLLQVLKGYRTPTSGSQLEALILSMESSPSKNTVDMDMEVKSIAQRIQKMFQSMPAVAGVFEDLENFNLEKQRYGISEIGSEEFGLFLYKLIKKYRLPIEISNNLNQKVGQQKMIQDIRGTQLFRDLENYIEKIKESLFQNAEEKALDREGLRLDLIESLIQLELTQEDWVKLESFLKNKNTWTIEADGVVTGSELRPLIEKLTSHIAFYVVAHERDGVFMKNTLQYMESYKRNQALIVAGGFHAEGLTRQFKEEGISYVLVRPQIDSMPDQYRYREHMQGQVSWRDYFEVKDRKVSVYDAFVRSTRDFLLRQTSEERGQLLKKWRDQIIRDLANKGEIEKAGNYVRFIDELRDQDDKGVHALKEKWFSAIDQYLDSLESLKVSGQLNERNVMSLLPSSYAAVLAHQVLGSDVASPHLLGLQQDRSAQRTERFEQRSISVNDLQESLHHVLNDILSFSGANNSLKKIMRYFFIPAALTFSMTGELNISASPLTGQQPAIIQMAEVTNMSRLDSELQKALTDAGVRNISQEHEILFQQAFALIEKHDGRTAKIIRERGLIHFIGELDMHAAGVAMGSDFPGIVAFSPWFLEKADPFHLAVYIQHELQHVLQSRNMFAFYTGDIDVERELEAYQAQLDFAEAIEESGDLTVDRIRLRQVIQRTEFLLRQASPSKLQKRGWVARYITGDKNLENDVTTLTKRFFNGNKYGLYDYLIKRESHLLQENENVLPLLNIQLTDEGKLQLTFERDGQSIVDEGVPINPQSRFENRVSSDAELTYLENYLASDWLSKAKKSLTLSYENGVTYDEQHRDRLQRAIDRIDQFDKIKDFDGFIKNNPDIINSLFEALELYTQTINPENGISLIDFFSQSTNLYVQIRAFEALAKIQRGFTQQLKERVSFVSKRPLFDADKEAAMNAANGVVRRRFVRVERDYANPLSTLTDNENFIRQISLMRILAEREDDPHKGFSRDLALFFESFSTVGKENPYNAFLGRQGLNTLGLKAAQELVAATRFVHKKTKVYQSGAGSILNSAIRSPGLDYRLRSYLMHELVDLYKPDNISDLRQIDTFRDQSMSFIRFLLSADLSPDEVFQAQANFHSVAMFESITDFTKAEKLNELSQLPDEVIFVMLEILKPRYHNNVTNYAFKQILSMVLHSDNLNFSDDVRLYAFGHLVEIAGEKEFDLKRATQSALNKLRSVDKQKTGYELINGFAGAYDLKVNNLAVLLWARQAEISVLNNQSALRKYLTATMKSRLLYDYNNANSAMEFGVGLMAKLSSQSFLMVTAHELMHRILEQELNYTLPGLHAGSVHEFVADLLALKLSADLEWDASVYFKALDVDSNLKRVKDNDEHTSGEVHEAGRVQFLELYESLDGEPANTKKLLNAIVFVIKEHPDSVRIGKNFGLFIEHTYRRYLDEDAAAVQRLNDQPYRYEDGKTDKVQILSADELRLIKKEVLAHKVARSEQRFASDELLEVAQVIVPADIRNELAQLIDLGKVIQPQIAARRSIEWVGKGQLEQARERMKEAALTALLMSLTEVKEGGAGAVVKTQAQLEAYQSITQALIATLTVLGDRTYSLGLALPKEPALTRSPLIKELLKIMQGSEGKVSEIIFDGKMDRDDQRDFTDQNAVMRSHNFRRTLISYNDQPAVPVLILEKTTPLLNEMFIPFSADLEGVEDQFVEAYIETLRSVAAIHVADLISRDKTLLLNPDRLKGELLSRLQRFGETYENILTRQGDGWMFIGAVARVQLEMEIARITAASA